MVKPMRQPFELPEDGVLVTWSTGKPSEPAVAELTGASAIPTGDTMRQLLKHICGTLIGVDKDELHRSENADW